MGAALWGWWATGPAPRVCRVPARLCPARPSGGEAGSVGTVSMAAEPPSVRDVTFVSGGSCL